MLSFAMGVLSERFLVRCLVGKSYCLFVLRGAGSYKNEDVRTAVKHSASSGILPMAVSAMLDSQTSRLTMNKAPQHFRFRG
jgi:hypothetical protein